MALALLAIVWGVIVAPWYYLYGTPMQKIGWIYGGCPFAESVAAADYVREHSQPDETVFVFGSELRALLEHPDVPRELDLESLSRYLVVEAVPAPHSILAGIAKVPPAHTLVVSPGAKPQLARYWTLPFAPDRSIGEVEWIERLRHQLEASVRSRLCSDVPIGVFVSGGIDSGAVAALAARQTDAPPLQTFAVGFEPPSYDERRFAEMPAYATNLP